MTKTLESKEGGRSYSNVGEGVKSNLKMVESGKRYSNVAQCGNCYYKGGTKLQKTFEDGRS